MIITRNGNIVTLELEGDEQETYDFMGSAFFSSYIENLFRSRKLQRIEELKTELTKGMTLEDLKAELVRKQNG